MNRLPKVVFSSYAFEVPLVVTAVLPELVKEGKQDTLFPITIHAGARP
jgi:hypothetical protein